MCFYKSKLRSIFLDSSSGITAGQFLWFWNTTNKVIGIFSPNTDSRSALIGVIETGLSKENLERRKVLEEQFTSIIDSLETEQCQSIVSLLLEYWGSEEFWENNHPAHIFVLQDDQSTMEGCYS